MSIVVTRTDALGYGFTATYTPDADAVEINPAAIVFIQTPEKTDSKAALKKTGITFSTPDADNENKQTAAITLSADEVDAIGVRNETHTDYKFVFVTTNEATDEGMSNMASSVDARENIQLKLSIVANSGVSLDNAMRFTIKNEDSSQSYSTLSTAVTDFEIVLSHNQPRNEGMTILQGSDSTIESITPVTGSTNQYLVKLAKQSPEGDDVANTDIQNDLAYEVSITGKTNSGHDTIPHGNTITITPSNIPVPPTSLAIATKLSGNVPDDTYPTTLTINWNDMPDEENGVIEVDYGRWDSSKTKSDGSAYSYTNDVEGYFYDGAKITLSDETQIGALKSAGTITVDLPLAQTFNLAEISGNDIKVGCIVRHKGTADGASFLSSAPVLVHAYNPTIPDIEFGYDGTSTIGADNQIAVDLVSGNQTIKFKTIALWQPQPSRPWESDKQEALTVTLHRPGLADITIPAGGVYDTVFETANSPQSVKRFYEIPSTKINQMNGAAGSTDRLITMSVTQNDPNSTSTPPATFTRTTDRSISILKAQNPAAGEVTITASTDATVAPTVVRNAADTIYDYTLKTLKLEGKQNGTLKSEFEEQQADATALSTAVAAPVDGIGGGPGQIITANVTGQAYTASNAISAKLTSTYALTHSNDWYGAIADYKHMQHARDSRNSQTVLLFEHPKITDVTVSGSNMTVTFDTKGASFDNEGHMPLTAYALINDSTGAHFETVTKAVDLAEEAADTTPLGGFSYSIGVSFTNAIVSDAGHGFIGLVHLDSSNANSDLKIVQAPSP